MASPTYAAHSHSPTASSPTPAPQMSYQSQLDPSTNSQQNQSSSLSNRSPKPTSSYYFGPPTGNTAFGTKPMGVIGRDRPREIVRIERDYQSGELCQFHPSFPLELEGRITPTTFSETINDLNVLLIRANDPLWACFDNIFDVLTLYLGGLVVGSRYKREMKKFQTFLDETNQKVFNPSGLNILPPKRCAFLFIEIEYY